MTSVPDREATYSLAGEFIGSGDFKAQARFITETWGGLAPEHKTVSRTDGNDREDLLKKESFTDVASGLYTTEPAPISGGTRH